MIQSFSFARIPNIIFGLKSFSKLFDVILNYGKNILIVTGGTSLERSGKWADIVSNMNDRGITTDRVVIKEEPSPTIIDQYTSEFRRKKIDLVIGIGGGSVTDAGKAISAMIPKKDSVKNYLEGVGTKLPDGEKIPYIAIPTTSGTGSEATKNAVISEIGPHGYKKSLRHENYVPDIAIIDPELMITCPPDITAACGLDAFTQLLESYVSTQANPMTDVLAKNGIIYVKDNLVSACNEGSSNINVRSGMAYGSLLSGITLANAGLGIVHGLAGPIGGLFEIPHGFACGTLLAEATKTNIELLKEKGQKGKESLAKYAHIGALVADEDCFIIDKIPGYCEILIEKLEEWTLELKIKRLGKFGIIEEDIAEIVDKASVKNNPVTLSKDNMKNILLNRL